MVCINDSNILRQIELFEKTGDILDKEIELVEAEHDSRINFINECSLMENEDLISISKKYNLESEIYMEATESLWQKFKKWVSGIVKAIFGCKDKIPEGAKTSKETITLDFDPKERISLLKKIVSTVKDNKSKVTIGSTVLAGAGLVAGLKKHFSKKKKTEMTKEEAVKNINKISEFTEEIRKKVDGMHFNVNSRNSKGSDTSTVGKNKDSTSGDNSNQQDTIQMQCMKEVLSQILNMSAKINSEINKNTQVQSNETGNKKNENTNQNNETDPNKKDNFDPKVVQKGKEQLRAMRYSLASATGKRANIKFTSIITKKDISDTITVISGLVEDLEKGKPSKKRDNLLNQANQAIENGKKLLEYMKLHHINEFAIDSIEDDEFLFFESYSEDLLDINELLEESGASEFDKLKLLIALS